MAEPAPNSRPRDRRAIAAASAAALAWSALAHLTLALAACGGPAPPVALTDAWPETPGEYSEVHRQWTRRGVLRTFDTEIAEVFATFKSPAWRAAYVAERARTLGLPDVQRDALRAEHAESAAQYYEVQLLVTTHDRRENDLQKGASSVWRLALVDDRGGQVEPVAITRDRRPLEVIRAEYPDMGDFAVAYAVRFPRDVEVVRQGASHFSLELASPRGAVHLVWRAAGN